MLDVERCNPEMAYFRDPRTQAKLVNILYVYCKLNPSLGYRQGMHELAASVLWVIEYDAAPVSSIEQQYPGRDNKYKSLGLMVDVQFVEQDSFELFKNLMESAVSFFQQQHPNDLSTAKKRSQTIKSPIQQRIERIFHRYLPEVDPLLASHLDGLEVNPQIFLL